LSSNEKKVKENLFQKNYSNSDSERDKKFAKNFDSSKIIDVKKIIMSKS
jgi:hypothetical protein